MNNLFDLSKSLIDQGLIDPTPINPRLPLPEIIKGIGVKELQSYSYRGRTLYDTPISYGWLKSFYLGLKYQAPYKFIEYRVNEKEDGSTSTYSGVMEIGNAVEKMLCGGYEFALSEYKFFTGAATSKKLAEVSEWCEIIKNTDWDIASDMYQASIKNPELKNILKNPNTNFQTKELQGFDEESGLKFSGILDLELNGVITDIKTTETLSDFPELFTKKMHYWLQAIIHKKIFGATDFQFFVIQRKKPHLSTFFRISPEKWEELELIFWNKIIVPYYQHLEDGFFLKYYQPDTRWL